MQGLKHTHALHLSYEGDHAFACWISRLKPLTVKGRSINADLKPLTVKGRSINADLPTTQQFTAPQQNTKI